MMIQISEMSKRNLQRWISISKHLGTFYPITAIKAKCPFFYFFYFIFNERGTQTVTLGKMKESFLSGSF